jgi:hypothetical protein
MNRPDHDDVKFFFGEEVEHTPAYGMNTLFVVGLQPANDIEYVLAGTRHQIQHIYFGANQSFPNLRVNDGAEWAKWELMIYPWLEKDYWCTLDIDIQCVEGLLESGLAEHDRFIPMISAKIPYIQQLGYNAVLKIDDRDFRATNPGVWCHSIHQLQSRRTFTDWSKYTQDAKLG